MVNFADFLILSNSFGQETGDAAEPNADFDCDGSVGFSDFLILSNSFGLTVAGEAATVPEPGCTVLLVTGAMLVVNVRRGRSGCSC